MSSIFLIIGLILQFIPSHSIQNASFTALIIGLVLVFFIKDKNESRKPLPEKFYQKKVFWAWIFIPLFVILFIYSIFLKKWTNKKLEKPSFFTDRIELSVFFYLPFILRTEIVKDNHINN